MFFGTILCLHFFVLGETTLLASQVPQPIKSPNTSSCSLPTVQECSVSVLTAPLHGSFSISCIVHSSQSAGTLVTTWSREHGTMNASRTAVTDKGKLIRNTSISIQDVQKSDEDTYTLTASSNCGEEVASTFVVVKAGGCKNYEPPNATHIVINDTDIVEGETFSISCLFNGDVSSAHYDVLWSLDVGKIDHNPNGKYVEGRNVDCPLNTPCCSFTGVLEVTNADTLDSGLYACTAVPVTIGKGGSSLSLHINVSPHSSKDTLDVDLVAGISSGGAILFAIVIVFVVSVTCLRIQRKQRRKHPYQLLVNEGGSSYYGSISQSLNLPASEARPSTLSTASAAGKEEPIFILYALEFESFYSIKNEDCPAYGLIVDFIQFLAMVDVHCSHDAYERFSTITNSQEFSSKVQLAVQEAKTVIVVCSEVLYAAFMECDAMVQMKYGKFRAESVLEIMAKSPKKFMPVFLAAECSVCTELHAERSYNLKDFERFMEETEGAQEERVTEILKKPEYAELLDFVNHL